MTTPPAPSASEQTKRLHTMGQDGHPYGEDCLLHSELCELARRLDLLESAARPAPGTRPTPSAWAVSHREGEPPQFVTLSQWPTAERVRELAREYHDAVDSHRAIDSQPGSVDDLCGFVSFVRARERAGKGNKGDPQRLTDDLLACPDCTPAHLCKRHSAEPLPTPPEAAAAPGDEAAREAQAIVDLEWVCLYYEKVSRAPGEEWPKDKWDNAAYEMVSMVRKALAGFRSLSRFPRPADNAMPEPERRVQAMAVAGRIFNKFVCPGTTPDTCTRAIADALLEFPRPADSRERESEAVAMLREVQWGGYGAGRGMVCPVCNAIKCESHKPGCRLAAVLGKGEDS